MCTLIQALSEAECSSRKEILWLGSEPLLPVRLVRVLALCGLPFRIPDNADLQDLQDSPRLQLIGQTVPGQKLSADSLLPLAVSLGVWIIKKLRPEVSSCNFSGSAGACDVSGSASLKLWRLGCCTPSPRHPLGLVCSPASRGTTCSHHSSPGQTFFWEKENVTEKIPGQMQSKSRERTQIRENCFVLLFNGREQ